MAEVDLSLTWSNISGSAGTAEDGLPFPVNSKYKATHTQAPNFAYKLAARKFNAMPETKRPRDLNLSSLQHMFNAAEPVTADAIADFEAAFWKWSRKSASSTSGCCLKRWAFKATKIPIERAAETNTKKETVSP